MLEWKSNPTLRLLALILAILAVVGISFLNRYAETFDAEVESLYLIPIAFVAWTQSRRLALAFAALAVIPAVWSCVVGHAESPFRLQTLFELVQHTGTFLTATLVVSLLADVMRERSHQAHMDGLTDVANASHFHEIVERELARAKRYGRPVTVGFIDVDDFKTVNDTLGHNGGDEILRAVAEVIKNGLRASDTVGRLGGDEFGVLLPETDAAEATAILERLRLQIAAESRAHETSVRASIGATSLDAAADATTAQAVIQRADALMYRVKVDGKNGVLVEAYE
ncbi:MAG: GGDEF domain-containing protein [Coriobacteriales bacterium]|nr:GGDEF domain-containing protein [Coriobacteriales bacterium]